MGHGEIIKPKPLCKIKFQVVSVLNYIPCNEGVWGSGGIAPSILKFGSRLRCNQLHTLADLPQGNNS
jgi:hypothetical protein